MANALIEKLSDAASAGSVPSFLEKMHDVVPNAERLTHDMQILYVVHSVARVLGVSYDPDDKRLAYGSISEIRRWTGLEESANHNLLIGGLSFALLCNRTSVDEDPNAEDPYALRPEIKDFLTREYGIEPHHFDAVEDFREGSTSLIFKIWIGGRYSILKLIKYQLVTEYAIISDLEQYSRICSENGDQTPELYRSGRKWIHIECVGDISLGQHLETAIFGKVYRREQGEQTFHPTLKKAHLAAFGENIRPIIQVLIDLAPLHHLDVSPENLMVVEQTPLRLKAIDFGVNSLLAGKSAATTEENRARVYISPEVTDRRPAGPLSDLYSVGVIALEILEGDWIAPGEVKQALDRAWRDFPGVASVLEDCLTSEPEYRGLSLRPPNLESLKDVSGADLFRALWSRLEVMIQSDTAAAEQQERGFLIRNAMKAKELGARLVQTASTNAQIGTAGSVDAVRKRQLDWYILVCLFACGLCVALVPSAIMLGDLDRNAVVLAVREAVGRLSFLGLDFAIRPFTLEESLPGRAICISFAFTATIYYLNIFSALRVPMPLEEPRSEPDGRGTGDGGGEKKRRNANLWMRFNSFCFAFPILYTLVLDPRTWPICSFLGLVFVGINNHIVSQAANRLHEGLPEAFPAKRNLFVASALSLFEGWGLLVFLYAFGILGLYPVLTYLVEPAVSPSVYLSIEWVFVAFVVLINAFKLVYVNCIKLGPSVRTALTRTFMSQMRADRMHAPRVGSVLNALRQVADGLATTGRSRVVSRIRVLARQHDIYDPYVERFKGMGVAVDFDDSTPLKDLAQRHIPRLRRQPANKTLLIKPTDP